MKKFAKWLFDNDVKQLEIANKLGISTTTVNNLVKKDIIPSLPIAYEIEVFTKHEITVYDWLPTKNNEIKKITKKKINTTEKKK